MRWFLTWVNNKQDIGGSSVDSIYVFLVFGLGLVMLTSCYYSVFRAVSVRVFAILFASMFLVPSAVLAQHAVSLEDPNETPLEEPPEPPFAPPPEPPFGPPPEPPFGPPPEPPFGPPPEPPRENECDIYGFHMRYAGMDYGVRPEDIFQYPSNRSPLECLKMHTDRALTFCESLNPNFYGYNVRTNYFDDCVMSYFTGLHRYHSAWGLYDFLNFYGTPDFEYKAQTCGYQSFVTGSFEIKPARNGQCPEISNDQMIIGVMEATFYFDENCNTVTDIPGDAEVCDEVIGSWGVSPISLLWNGSVDVERSPTVSSFPLEPGKPSRFYQWKASEDAPLLVYDPNHSGTITSAFQLFGNWTFGGKVSASKGVASNDLDALLPTAWENGYEALASLDRDASGAVEAEELEPLGLWFDANRDGVSQKGEVKRLREVGVTRLFYRSDYTDPVTGNIYAERGFERETTSGIVTGTSVDWYGKHGETPFEVIQETMPGGRTSCQ